MFSLTTGVTGTTVTASVLSLAGPYNVGGVTGSVPAATLSNTWRYDPVTNHWCLAGNLSRCMQLSSNVGTNGLNTVFVSSTPTGWYNRPAPTL